jgi:hypothetical protein
MADRAPGSDLRSTDAFPEQGAQFQAFLPRLPLALTMPTRQAQRSRIAR